MRMYLVDRDLPGMTLEQFEAAAIVRFSNITGRPGFGGLFVEEGT